MGAPQAPPDVVVAPQPAQRLPRLGDELRPVEGRVYFEVPAFLAQVGAMPS